MKNIRKITAIFLSLVFVLLGALPASAALTEGKNYEFETVYLNAYYNTGQWQTANGNYHDNYGQVSLRTLKSTGEPIYCIQVYEGVSGSNAKASDFTNTDIWKNELSAAQQRQIIRVSIHGYPNNTFGYSAQDAQLATQVLIWEIETGARSDWSTGCTSWAADIFDNYSNALKAYNEIVKACSSHATRPNFNSSSIELTGVGESNAKTLTDSNGVLNSFTVTSSNSKIKTSVSGNKLKIWSTASGDISATLTLTKKNTDINSVFALTGANQTLMYGTLADPVTTRITVSMATGSIKIVKTSEDGKIKNIPFTITGNGVNESVKSGTDGTVTVDDLAAGTYTVSETVGSTYAPQSSKSVNVVAGKTTTVTFNNTLKRGSLEVTKDAEDGVLKGHKFHLYGTADSGAAIDEYATTNASGKAVFSDVLIGSKLTLEEVETKEKYVIPSKQTVSIAWDSVTKTSFKNNLKKFTLTVTKKDSVTGATAQGNATLEGAVYGVYKGGTLLDTYTTDANGKFTTKEYACGSDYTLKEISPSFGYLLDETVYSLTDAAASNFTAEHNKITLTVKEKVTTGKIAIIKHSDNGATQIETPEVNAEFEIYLKSAGSFAAADDKEKDLLTTDENGFAQTKDLPFGTYTVHQTKGNGGAELIRDFTVVINRNGETYRFIINNAPFESYLKFVKVDSETGNTIPVANTGIQLYDPEGNLITMSFTYPTPTTIDTFYTNEEGYLITPEKLTIGEGYKAIEVQAPFGYVLSKTPVVFNISPDTATDENGLTVVTITKANRAQKGTIEIVKLGEVFSSVITDGTFYKPAYELTNNVGAKFRITAAEDIITPDGTVRVSAGTVVDEITVGETSAVSKKLYLGKYYVEEIEAAPNMVLDTTKHEVVLAYAGQNVSVTSATLTVTNERQRVSVDLVKVLEKDDLFNIGNTDELSRVQFALYADEELAAADGSVIPADALIEIVSPNEDGTATFSTDLPVGSKVYVKEYSTDEHYILSDEKFPVEFEYAGQDVALVQLHINDGNEIENRIIRGSILGMKTDENDMLRPGVLFGLFKEDETEFTEGTALMLSETDENGSFSFLNVAYGKYLVKEIKAPQDLIMNADVVPVEITENGQVIEIKIVNNIVKGSLVITKSDITNGKVLANVGFRIRNEQGEIIREGYTDKNGIVRFDNLLYGKYTYQEFSAKEGYILDEKEYPFEITEDGQIIKVEMTNKPIPVPEIPVIPKTGGTDIIKYLIPVSFLSAATLFVTRKKKENENEE